MNLRTALRQAVIAASEPVPLSSLTKALSKRLRPATAELQSAVDALTSEGTLFKHPPQVRRKNATPRYWPHSPATYVERRLRAGIGRRTRWTAAALRKKIPAVYHEHFDEALGRLLATGELHQIGRGRARVLSTKRLRPTDFLTAGHTKSLRAVLAKVNIYLPMPLSLQAVLHQLDGGGDLPQHDQVPPTARADLTEAQLATWYRNDLPRRGGLRSLPIPWAWERYVTWSTDRGETADPDRFHGLLQQMWKAGRADLAPHDNPGSVPPNEAATLRRDPDGRLIYYWQLLP